MFDDGPPIRRPGIAGTEIPRPHSIRGRSGAVHISREAGHDWNGGINETVAVLTTLSCNLAMQGASS